MWMDVHEVWEEISLYNNLLHLNVVSPNFWAHFLILLPWAEPKLLKISKQYWCHYVQLSSDVRVWKL